MGHFADRHPTDRHMAVLKVPTLDLKRLSVATRNKLSNRSPSTDLIEFRVICALLKKKSTALVPARKSSPQAAPGFFQVRQFFRHAFPKRCQKLTCNCRSCSWMQANKVAQVHHARSVEAFFGHDQVTEGAAEPFAIQVN